MPISKRENVIEAVLKALEMGNLIPSNHAQAQMKARDILMSDLEEALYQAQREESHDRLTDDGRDYKYSLRGKNANGDKDLRIVIVFHDPKVIIITAIDKNK